LGKKIHKCRIKTAILYAASAAKFKRAGIADGVTGNYRSTIQVLPSTSN